MTEAQQEELKRLESSVKLPDLNFKPRPFAQLENWERRLECREHQLREAIAEKQMVMNLLDLAYLVLPSGRLRSEIESFLEGK